MGISIYLYQGQQTFSVKGQRVNILDKKEEVIEMGNVHPGQIKLQR